MKTAITLFIGALAMSQIWSLMVIAEYRSGDISPARYEFYKVNKGGEQYGITYEDATAKGKQLFESARETLGRGF